MRRYLRCVADAPAHGLRSGDLIEIDPRADPPIISIRTHGADLRAFQAKEAEGLLCPTEGTPPPPSAPRRRAYPPLRLVRA